MHPHTKHTFLHALFFLILIVAVIVLGLFLVRAPTPATKIDWGNLTEVYENTAYGYAIHYPGDYAVDNHYVYTELGPGKFIEGVKFTIASSSAVGTNLGQDSYLSIERIATTSACAPSLFLDQAPPAQTITEQGVTYSVASTTGAGAGNRYEETVYALPATVPCLAVRYFIHYSVIENYPTGTVREFDKQALLQQFDAIRHTLLLAQ